VGVVVNAPFPRRRRLGSVVRNAIRLVVLGAWRNWVRNLGSTAPALGSMTLLLMLAGLVGMGAYAIQRVAAAQASSAAVLHVYLRDDARPQDVDALRHQLASDRRVASVSYTTKQQALERAKTRPGLSSLASASDSNPFPASLDVKLRSVNDVGALAAVAARSPAVDPIMPTSYDRGAYQRIQKVLTVLSVIGAAFLLLLGFVAVTVTANSIRAAILARRNEVKIMELVGARHWMVRGPFVVEGALTGGVAGVVAAVLTLAVSLTGMALGADSFERFAPGVTPVVALIAGGLLVVGGLVLGALASLLGVHRELGTA
jgi:cell division transport system permease protein